MMPWIDVIYNLTDRFDIETAEMELQQFPQFNPFNKWTYLTIVLAVDFLVAQQKLTPQEAYALYVQERNSGNTPPPDLDASRGLGDTVAKFTHATKLDKLAELYTKLTGKPCGCSERQDLLNKLVPYKDTQEYKDALSELE